MDERRYNRRDPWEPGMYETGRTRPRKSYGGLVALLLVVVILLCGIISALSVLNVKLFAELEALSVPKEDSLSFINESEDQHPLSVFDPSAPTDAAIIDQGADDSFILMPSPQSVPNVVQEGGLSLQDIYEKTINSVVSISSQGPDRSGTGTGVIISRLGYIVTNCHVVEGAQSVTVRLTDERSFAATIIGSDAVSDLAVLHISAADLTPAEFGDSAVLRVGDSVAAIGDPLGEEFRGTLTNGIVSAINRDVTTGGRTLTLIQTNAALNSGNSGGPLINCYGQVIGINTMKIGDYASASGVEGLGFAIPVSTVKEVVDQLIAQGYVSGRPTLGLSGESITKFDRYYFHIPEGLYLTGVDEHSDAFLQGIAPGDILISLEGQVITTQNQLDVIVNSCAIGDTLTAVIYRNSQEETITLTVTEYVG